MKQKQIEEIKEALPCIEVVRDLYDDFSLAEWLYDKGVRKIPEGAVVLTREEYQTANYWRERAQKWKKAAHDIRKETAEKFAEMVKNLLEQREYKTGCSAYMMCTKTAKACVDEIAKEITEGK